MLTRAALVSVFLLACGGSSQADPSQADAALSAAPEVSPADAADAAPQAPAAGASVEQGHTVFQRHCSTCHGPDGQGDGPVADVLDPRPTDLTGPRPEHLRGRPGGRRAAIADGIAGTSMQGYTGVLSAEELEAVYAYVHSLRHGSGGGGMGPGMGSGAGPGHGSGAGPCGSGQQGADCPGGDTTAP